MLGRTEPSLLPKVLRVGLVLVGLLPWMIPLLRAHLSLGAFGVALDGAFLSMCHRMPDRTLELAGVAMPLCSRCAGIFAGTAAGGLIALPRLGSRLWRRIIVATILLMALDVATQDLDLHAVWHPTRLASGFLFGYAIAVACLDALTSESARTGAIAGPRSA